jgi:hypothetical protein
MKVLLALIAKLFGKGAVSKTIGSRTNVIKLADNDAKRFIKNELNIEAAGEAAIQKGLKDAESLIADIPKMNDQEILTFTGNLKRLDQKINPPQAEVLDITTQQKVSPEGIASLTETVGQKAPPGTLMGDLELNVNKLKASGKQLEDIAKEKGGRSLDDIMKGEGQAQQGMAQAQKEGLVKATANDIMIADINSGKFLAPKEMQQEILQGSSKSLDYFRRFYGEDALEVLDSLTPDLAKMRTSREAADFAKKQYNFEAKMDRLPGSISPEDAAKAEKEFGLGSLKDDIDDPEGFAKGGLANLLQVDKRTDYAVGGMGLTQQSGSDEGLVEKVRARTQQMEQIKRDMEDRIKKGSKIQGLSIGNLQGGGYGTVTRPLERPPESNSGLRNNPMLKEPRSNEIYTPDNQYAQLLNQGLRPEQIKAVSYYNTLRNNFGDEGMMLPEAIGGLGLMKAAPGEVGGLTGSGTVANPLAFQNFFQTPAEEFAFYQEGLRRSMMQNPNSDIYFDPDKTYDTGNYVSPKGIYTFRDIDPNVVNRGMMVDGKEYFSEQDAIDDMGVERYNQFMASGGRVGYEQGGLANLLGV